ncbi:MAG: DUF1501 domain-containing protein [Planctomycetota bacterium]
MNPITTAALQLTRRRLLQRMGQGLGVAALGDLLQGHGSSAPTRGTHFAPRAKRAIWLFMAGAPSQLDTFDPKPGLAKLFDTDLPESIRRGQRLTTMTSGQARFPIAPSKYRFDRFDNGNDGAWVSELLPWQAKAVDKMAIVRSLWTEAINHDPAITYICTGRELPGWPSLGSWLSYGLGSENENLPKFVVMTPTWSGRKDAQALYTRLWGAGLLPSEHQAVALRSKGDPVLFLRDPEGVDRATRRAMLDALGSINDQRARLIGDPEIEMRTAQYEMAFRMQSSVPELTDLSREPDSVVDMYGPDARRPGTFAASCLLARRMMERGVRFVQIFHRGWDQHGNVAGDLPKQCRDVDQPAWALLEDLQRRGLLDETLVIWGGEFGRTVYCQGELTRENYGRDHHPRCFTMWAAGGGIRRGIVHGETDEFSYNIVRDPVHVRDFNATVLHCLGFEHERLSIEHQGLEVRLTSAEPARVVRELLA